MTIRMIGTTQMMIDEFYIECSECGEQFMVGERQKFIEHLMADHEYRFELAEHRVQQAIDAIPSTDNGYLMFECPYHGFYTEYECKLCEPRDD